MPTKIYLLRHGQALHNVAMPGLGPNNPVLRDAALTEAGHAEVTALKAQINGLRFDAIYCSPLQRCRQTLKGSYPRSVYLPVNLDDRLLEQPYGSYISNKRQEKEDIIATSPVHWNTTRIADTNPHVLTPKKTEYQLIKDFVKELLCVHPDESVLIVTHGKWINRFLKKFCGVSRWIRNCECLEVSLSDMPVEMAAEMAAEMEEKNMMVQDEELYLAEEYEGPTVKRFKSV
jgi:broad specificity phosphatase PhoE